MQLNAISTDEIVQAPSLNGAGNFAVSRFGSLPLASIPGEGGGKTIAIRLADTQGQRNTARMLLNKAFAWRGYGDNHEIKASEYHSTFTASTEEGLIGTMTLAVDSAAGLAVDNTFKEEVDRFRAMPGTRVCELSRFAFETNASSKPLLASLFHVIFIYGSNKYGCTDLLIECAQRHVRFYESMLGFRRVGALKTNVSVNTSAQLLHLKLSEISDYIRDFAGKDPGTSRLLYPYFFSAKEAHGIYGRLAEMGYPMEAVDPLARLLGKSERPHRVPAHATLM